MKHLFGIWGISLLFLLLQNCKEKHPVQAINVKYEPNFPHILRIYSVGQNSVTAKNNTGKTITSDELAYYFYTSSGDTNPVSQRIKGQFHPGHKFDAITQSTIPIPLTNQDTITAINPAIPINPFKDTVYLYMYDTTGTHLNPFILLDQSTPYAKNSLF